MTDNIICLYAWLTDLRLKLFIDLLSSCVNDLLKLSERYRIGRLFWPILSTIGLSDFHTIILTLIAMLTKQLCQPQTEYNSQNSSASIRMISLMITEFVTLIWEFWNELFLTSQVLGTLSPWCFRMNYTSIACNRSCLHIFRLFFLTVFISVTSYDIIFTHDSVYAIACICHANSVYLSVCHTCVLYQNGWTYHQNSFTIW